MTCASALLRVRTQGTDTHRSDAVFLSRQNLFQDEFELTVMLCVDQVWTMLLALL